MQKKSKPFAPGRYVVTYAQNGTPIHRKFWRALQHYPAKILVIAGRYKNPTSVFAEADVEGDWWAPEVVPHIVERVRLCPNLTVYGDISIQPTADRPLTGWEVFCGANSGIFGHPKLALETIATATRHPRLLMSTGACTVPNYTPSKAGKKAEAHHALGAVVVEVEADGTYHLRHISAGDDGSFYDLDRRYSPRGALSAGRAEVLTLGDVHVGTVEWSVRDATKQLFDLVRPRHLVLHDVLDMSSANPHETGVYARSRPRYFESVREELHAAHNWLKNFANWSSDHKTHVVASNHDCMLERWLDDARPERLSREDLLYYYDLWYRRLRNPPGAGLFAAVCEEIEKHPRLKFHSEEDDLLILGCAYNFHGHRGAAGGKGNPNVYAKLGVKTVTGHAHVPSRRDGNITVGVTGALRMGYNKKPSAWLNSHCLTYPDGKRTLVHIINGRFRSGAEK